MKTMTPQKTWQHAQMAKGNCPRCGKKATGKWVLCKPCRDKNNLRRRKSKSCTNDLDGRFKSSKKRNAVGI